MTSLDENTETLKLLLQDSRIDPSAQNNNFIILASKYGHLEIVKLLLQDFRVDPSAQNNKAIKKACKNNHFEIVEILMKDRRFRKIIIDDETS